MLPIRSWCASVLLLTLTLAAFAQPPANPVAPPAPEAKPDNVVREQTIYVPYSRIKGVFEKEGRGVFLPYEKFQELWQKARAASADPAEAKPPVGALVAAVESEAVAEAEVVSVSARLTVELLAEGWQEVPLRLNDAALRSATIAGQPARVVHRANAGYVLLIEHKKKEPATVEVQLEYAKAFAKAPGLNSVSFEAPQAPVNRWRIRIPETGVKVQVYPLLAATEPPKDEPKNADPKNPAKPETVVLAFVGAAPQVRIDWTPKSEGAAGLAALANVQAEHEFIVDEGIVRNRTRLTYQISRAELPQLVFEVPADYKVVNVFDANVRQWDVQAKADPKAAVQQVTVQLYEPAKTTQHVTVELERISDGVPKDVLALTGVKAVGVGRQQGLVVVHVGTELRAELAERTGLLQVDATELPSNLASGKWDLTFRYSALPFTLGLKLEKLEPKVRVHELAEVYLEPEKLTLDLFAMFEIERVGVFQLAFDIPAGFDIRQVVGSAAAGVEAVTVDSYHTESPANLAAGKSRLVVELSKKALGKVGLFVELEKRLDDPNLRTPTGSTTTLPLVWPRTAMTLERVVGRLIVYAPDSLRLTSDKVTGLTRVSFAEALAGSASHRNGRFPTSREVLSYAYAAPPATASLTVERRQPHVTARQMLRVKIDAGVVTYNATFHYDIQYSGVKALRIDVPKELAPKIRTVTQSVLQTTLDKPAKLDGGYVAWSFTGDTEFTHQPVLHLTWQDKMEDLAVGKSVPLEIPQLRPKEVDRAWGQIVLAKAEALDLRPLGTPTGLIPIDPQHDLQPGLSPTDAADAARAFEFHEDWSLGLTITRYKLEEVKRTSIEQAVVRMVVTLGEQLSVQALYRMRSAHQRLEVKLPDKAVLDSVPVRINGKPVPLESGQQGEYYIPLAEQTADTPFVLELRYGLDKHPGRFDLPEFPSEPAAQQVQLCAYVPEERVLLGSLGAWTPLGQPLFFDHSAYTHANDQQFVTQVTQGIETPNFPTDGRLYVFSTLRPAPSTAGSLRLVTMKSTWLKTLVFLAIAAGGIALCFCGWSRRIVATTGLIIALVTSGVFLPTFAAQILDGVLFAAIALVGLLWLTETGVREMPSCLAWMKRERGTRGVGDGGTSPPPAPATPFAAQSAPTEPTSSQGGANHE